VRVGLGSSTAVAKKREVLRVLSREKTVPALPRKKNLISKRESTCPRGIFGRAHQFGMGRAVDPLGIGKGFGKI